MTWRPTGATLFVEKVAAPTVNDDQNKGYLVGDIWIDETNDKCYICLDVSVGAAVWTELGGAGGGVTDHGALTGLGDDDHGQYVKDSEFTADSEILVGTGAGTFQKESGATLRTSIGVDAAGTLSALATKDPPIDADKAIYRDSTASDGLVTSTWTQVKAFLKTYFDTLYNKYVHPNHSGEVTSVADGEQTIAAAAVTLTKMANMATASLLGRNTAGVGVPEVLPKATVLSLLNVADGADVTSSNETQENILINQDFSIWQENTTFTNPANNVYTADGYVLNKIDGGGTAPSINVKKNSVNMETGFGQCCELGITNVGVSDVGRRWKIIQPIEDYKRYAGRTLTATIRIKASTVITLSQCFLQIADGVGGDSVSISSITTDWVTYSINRAIDASTTELELRFILDAGNGTISTTGSIYVQWMKLELGSVATPLIPRRTGDELRLCQRYYQKSYPQGTFAGAATGDGSKYQWDTNLANANHTIRTTVTLPVIMKAAPTVILYDIAGTSGKVSMAVGDNIVGVVASQSDSGFRVEGTNGTNDTTRKLAFHYTAISRV